MVDFFNYRKGIFNNAIRIKNALFILTGRSLKKK